MSPRNVTPAYNSVGSRDYYSNYYSFDAVNSAYGSHDETFEQMLEKIALYNHSEDTVCFHSVEEQTRVCYERA